jgi:phage protein U
MWVRGRLTINGMASCKIEFEIELKRVRSKEVKLTSSASVPDPILPDAH